MASIWSSLLVLLTLLGGLLTLASWMDPQARTVLFCILGFFAVQAIPVYLFYRLNFARQRRRVLRSIELIDGRITVRLAARPEWILGLDLARRDIADLRWEALHTLSHLESLDLAHTNTTNDQLETLGRMPRLRFLNLNQTAITDEGLAALGSFPRLEFVSLTDTAVSENGLEVLALRLPKLQVEAGHLPPLEELAAFKDATVNAHL